MILPGPPEEGVVYSTKYYFVTGPTYIRRSSSCASVLQLSFSRVFMLFSVNVFLSACAIYFIGMGLF